MPTLTVTQLPSLTPLPPTLTSTETPIETPLPTLNAEQTEETISSLLQGSADCQAPCFWGIIPGETTLSEANDIFTHLGLEIASAPHEGKEFYGTRYDFDNGLSISVILTVQNQIVENLRIKIDPEQHKPDIPREWLAFSPETLIRQYDAPSRVELVMIAGPGTSTYFEMDMYFDTADLIVVYEGPDMVPWQANSLEVCPLTAPFDFVRTWIGPNPVYPPESAVPLETATEITLEEFAELIAGDPETACIKLKSDVFFP